LALLPVGTDEGTRLHCELFQYKIIEWELFLLLKNRIFTSKNAFERRKKATVIVR
jgi:hypothetical protein